MTDDAIWQSYAQKTKRGREQAILSQVCEIKKLQYLSRIKANLDAILFIY